MALSSVVEFCGCREKCNCFAIADAGFAVSQLFEWWPGQQGPLSGRPDTDT